MLQQFIITFLICFLGQTALAQDRTIHWQNDLDFFQRELPLRHKNLFWKLPKAEFDAEMEKIKSEIEALEDYEVALRLQQILTKVGDSHTSIRNPFLAKTRFPIGYLYWFSDGIFVTWALEGYKEILGKQIVAINDVPIDRILKKYKTLFVQDNEGMVKKTIPNMLPEPKYLPFFGIGNEAEASFSFKDDNDKILKINLKAIPFQEFIETPRHSLLGEDRPLAYQRNGDWFWQKYFPEEQILYAQYNRCFNKKLGKRFNIPQKHWLSFKKFKKDIVKTLKKEPVQKLVFDMRFNSGGSSLQGSLLVRKLAQMDINNQNKIYVVIGRRTFSSGIFNTFDFQKHTDAILLGESTSGKSWSYGEIKKMILPNSQLSLWYSTKYFKRGEKDIPCIEPDVLLEISFKDFKNSIDPVLEYVMR